MAQHLNVITRWALCALLANPAYPALAGISERDPTLPPASLNAPTDNSANTATPIQLITINGKRRAAIVRGALVKVGDNISEGRITGITDSGIRVKSEDGSSVLKLFPDVDKHRHTSNQKPSIRGIQR
ncbi:MAG: hypothetical protein ACYCSS_03490 [Sulfuriferula sp.]